MIGGDAPVALDRGLCSLRAVREYGRVEAACKQCGAEHIAQAESRWEKIRGAEVSW